MRVRFAILNGSLDALLESNPSASSADLADTLTSYIEACIFEAIETIPLPPIRIPSPTTPLLRTLMARRRRKSGRRGREDISLHESFVRELYHIRSELDGRGEDSTVPKSPVRVDGGSRTMTKLPRDYGAADVKGSIAVGGDGLDRTPFLRLRRDSGNLLPRVRPSRVSFSLESRLQELVASDVILEQVAKATELSLRMFALESEVTMELNFTIANDPEYPNWTRYIIKIDTPLDFERRMRLWSEMDAWVRKDLSRLRGATPDDSLRIKDITSNLFLDMELV